MNNLNYMYNFVCMFVFTLCVRMIKNANHNQSLGVIMFSTFLQK